MSTHVIIALIIMLAYLFSKMMSHFNEQTHVKSDADGRYYTLRNKYSSAKLQESANVLAEINRRVIVLIDAINDKYGNDPSKAYFIRKLKDTYTPESLSEAARDTRYTTYTIDKKDIYVCIRTRDSKEDLYSINELMYVVFHELAHMANYNHAGEAIMGHGLEFQVIFKFLLSEAINLNLYQYKNYKTQPQEYCGITINSNILS